MQIPAPTGAMNETGAVCVGYGRGSSLRFYHPDHGVFSECLCDSVAWKPYDANTICILQNVLRQVLQDKGVVPFDRGVLASRLVEQRFYLMEVNRGVLWPRYKWWLPYSLTFTEALWMLIRFECNRAEIVAEPDTRPPSEEIRTGDDVRCPVRMINTYDEWLEDLHRFRHGETLRNNREEF